MFPTTLLQSAPERFSVVGPVPFSDIEEWEAGRKRIFVWAWAKYRDIFNDTPLHVTSTVER